MKKRHIAGWLFIAAFGAGVFFIGWTQWRVGPGKCGIVMSKTSGKSSEAVLPGVFSWHWEFLLPTNATLVIFPVGERIVTGSASGSLPSSALYGAAFSEAGITVDFTYDVVMEFTANVTADMVSSLCANGTVTDEASLTDYMERQAKAAAEKAAAIFLSGAADVSLEEVQGANGVFNSARVVKCRLPDAALYETVRSQYIRRLQEKEERTLAMKSAVSSLLEQYPELKSGGHQLGLDMSSINGILPQTAKEAKVEGKSLAAERKLAAIRGAVLIAQDDEQSVTNGVCDMCRAIFKQNALKTQDIVSVVFTVTSDIRSINPATSLRKGSAGGMEGVDVSKVPLFCAQEPEVNGMMKSVIRVMVTAYMDGSSTAKSAYLNGAEKLRPDMANGSM